MEKEIEQIMIKISDWPLEAMEELAQQIEDSIAAIKEDANR